MSAFPPPVMFLHPLQQCDLGLPVRAKLSGGSLMWISCFQISNLLSRVQRIGYTCSFCRSLCLVFHTYHVSFRDLASAFFISINPVYHLKEAAFNPRFENSSVHSQTKPPTRFWVPINRCSRLYFVNHGFCCLSLLRLQWIRDTGAWEWASLSRMLNWFIS